MFVKGGLLSLGSFMPLYVIVSFLTLAFAPAKAGNLGKDAVVTVCACCGAVKGVIDGKLGRLTALCDVTGSCVVAGA